MIRGEVLLLFVVTYMAACFGDDMSIGSPPRKQESDIVCCTKAYRTALLPYVCPPPPPPPSSLCRLLCPVVIRLASATADPQFQVRAGVGWGGRGGTRQRGAGREGGGRARESGGGDAGGGQVGCRANTFPSEACVKPHSPSANTAPLPPPPPSDPGEAVP